MVEVQHGFGIVEFVLLLGVTLLVGVPVLVGFAFGKKPAVIVAVVALFFAVPFILLLASFDTAHVAMKRDVSLANVATLNFPQENRQVVVDLGPVVEPPGATAETLIADDLPVHGEVTMKASYAYEPSIVPVIAFLLVIALLIGVPLLAGFAFGKKPGVIVAIGMVFVGGMLSMLVASYRQVQEQQLRTQHAGRLKSQAALRMGPMDAVAESLVERPPAEPQDPALQTFAALLAEQSVFSDRARPAWADQAPGLDHGVYRWSVKSGLYSTQEECRQALAAAVAQAVAQYGKTLLADPSAAGVLLRRPNWLVAMQRNHPQLGEQGHSGNGTSFSYEYKEAPQQATNWSAPKEPRPFPEVTASGHTNLIEQPLYAETVSSTVGDMHQLHALVELGDNARAQIREAWRQTIIPHRVRWAACGFGGVLAIVAVLLAALRLDLASGGRHRGRLRWATVLTILLVVGSACGFCLSL
ncbi:MAG TPA: hypothetical protein VGG30_09470 [Pirellulales bacterium]|jgi:hypothetical protein